MRITPGIGHNLKLIMGFSKQHRCTLKGADGLVLHAYNSLANTTSSSRLQCGEHHNSGIISGLGSDVHVKLIWWQSDNRTPGVPFQQLSNSVFQFHRNLLNMYMYMFKPRYDIMAQAESSKAPSCPFFIKFWLKYYRWSGHKQSKVWKDDFNSWLQSNTSSLLISNQKTTNWKQRHVQSEKKQW